MAEPPAQHRSCPKVCFRCGERLSTPAAVFAELESHGRGCHDRPGYREVGIPGARSRCAGRGCDPPAADAISYASVLCHEGAVSRRHGSLRLAHYWARELSQLGHEVRLIPPSYVKPYVKRQKNDMADAEAICEAVTRPSMRFVPVKSPGQQSVMVLHRTRSILVRQRTQLSNAIRGHMSEFGIVAPIGRNGLQTLKERVDAGDARVPEEAGACLLSFSLSSG
jgi:hypothetical protein